MQPYEILKTKTWPEGFSEAIQTKVINDLENGKLLYFPHLAFTLNEDEKCFLSPNYVEAKAKNISFDMQAQHVKGAHATVEEYERIKAMMLRFSEHARALIHQLFPHYQNALIHARTSFRPVDISNRKTSYRKDDRLLHVDAFPANPNQGRRILRVFSNINPIGEARVWRIGEPFEDVAKRFLPKVKKPLPLSSSLLKLLKITKSQRTEYDHIMLEIHNSMKANLLYQKEVPQIELRFPPGSTWVVQTDQVSHAAMKGQHMLEQTFYLPVDAMLEAQRSPLKVLERLAGRILV